MPPCTSDHLDREAFRVLWRAWKAGKGKDEAEAEKARLLATAKGLTGLDGAGGCEASRRFLQSARAHVQSRVTADAAASDETTITLFRGLRGGGDAEDFRRAAAVPSGRLLSYSTKPEPAVTFAGMGEADGLVYCFAVPRDEIVFYEDSDLCKEFEREQEVLVFHATVPTIDASAIVTDPVKNRPKFKFGSKTPKPP
jgi:hypothetical protein